MLLRAFDDYIGDVTRYLVELDFDRSRDTDLRDVDVDGFRGVTHAPHGQRNRSALHVRKGKATIFAGARNSTLLSLPLEFQLGAGNRCTPLVDDNSVDCVPSRGLWLGHERPVRQQRKQKQASRQYPWVTRAHRSAPSKVVPFPHAVLGAGDCQAELGERPFRREKLDSGLRIAPPHVITSS